MGGRSTARSSRALGRFPHRNAILGRQSTPEELAFPEGAGLDRLDRHGRPHDAWLRFSSRRSRHLPTRTRGASASFGRGQCGRRAGHEHVQVGMHLLEEAFLYGMRQEAEHAVSAEPGHVEQADRLGNGSRAAAT
ncbi:DUF924 family protein [Cupriavidus basilensis]